LRGRSYVVLLSVRQDGSVSAGSACAVSDERPYIVLPEGYQVGAAGPDRPDGAELRAIARKEGAGRAQSGLPCRMARSALILC